MVWFSWFKQSPIDVCSGINVRTKSTDCVHLTGNDGLKAAVTQAEDYISQHPNHQVIKSSVGSDQTTVVTIAVNVFFNIPFAGKFTDCMKYLVSSAHQLRVTWLGQPHENIRAIK